MDRIAKAQAIIEHARHKKISVPERAKRAIELAGLMLEEANATRTAHEKQLQSQLARMMRDPSGKVFVTSMTDQCFRSSNPARIANQLVYLLKKFGVPRFLPLSKRILMQMFKLLGNFIPNLLAPLAKDLIHQETTTVILPGDPELLRQHIEKRRKEGIRVNLNHLGEAILGEKEAEHRLQVYLSDLAKPEIEYISVKISTICSQINSLAWEETLEIIMNRLKQLYRDAEANIYVRLDGIRIPKFVNLDMEEYRDLRLTVDAFKRVLDDPEFHHHAAGIVLQSYLPDSFAIQQELTEWARKRVAKGHAPIKIRIVKGANLAMEQVEASLRDWPQAPFTTKADVDASFKKMLAYGCDPQNAYAARLGIGSHNLFDIAYALLLRSENDIEEYVCFEMLEGMAEHIRRVVQKLSHDMLLYCPAATKEEFQNAVAYLVRRLDENTAPENFLRHSFDLHVGSEEWNEQARLFEQACENLEHINSASQRIQNRFSDEKKDEYSAESSPFANEPDTDWTLPMNRKWANEILERWKNRKPLPIPIAIGGKQIFNEGFSAIGEDPSSPGKPLYHYAIATEAQAEEAILAAENAKQKWAHASVQERSKLLASTANRLRQSRSELIGAMIADTGKTIPEADVEVSEAIDFAEYYRRNIVEIATMKDIKWQPQGIVLVAPPWNFPCSIPAGGILAALAAGNCVIFKPAREAILVGWQLVQAFWEAGVDKNVLQFIAGDDETIGTQLVKDPRIDCIVLTGATATAKLMLKLRPGLHLAAETGGKNAIIVTAMSDRDLAIKDIIQSAFGHAGQKCSACSLLICEAEVYDDPHFMAQLRDAAASLQVGSQWDPATKVNPLIHEPNPTLLRGLTQLEEGEKWLLAPKQDPNNPNLWSPGIKLGVTQNSFTYNHELFGPVLSVMRADHLEHAIKLANGTPYGLTAGLHSLDEREMRFWIRHIETGNCYINRTITGAIVQRQPFGGCKESSFGPGAKAGGPNYVMQLMKPKQTAMPEHTLPIASLNKEIKSLHKFIVKTEIFNKNEIDVWSQCVGSFAFFWKHYFSKKWDPTRILGQDNFFFYTPHRHLLLRTQKDDDLLDIFLVAAAASICRTPLEISGEPSPLFEQFTKAFRSFAKVNAVAESDEQLIKRLGEIKRIRMLSEPSSELQKAFSTAACNVLIAPVIGNGRIELTRFLREVSLSYDYHRYGNLGSRECEPRGPDSLSRIACSAPKCCGGTCS